MSINNPFKGLFNNENVISESDLNSLKAYNAALESGVSPMTAYYKTLQNASDKVVKMAEGAQGAQVDITNLTTKVKFGEKALDLFAKASNMVIGALAGMAISWAVTKLIEGIDNLANSTEHCAERVNDLMSSYENALNTANTNAKKIDEIADRYEKLSRGVDGLGQNVSLANDEFEEYNSLTSEIAEMFPTLVQGYTEEGNAILNLKGNVEQLRDAYKEAQDEAYKLLITDGGDIVDNWKNTNKTPFINTFFDGYINRDVGKGISKKEAVRELEEFSNMSFKEFVKAQSKNPSSSLSYLHKALDFSFDTYTDEEEFEKAKKQARVLIKKYNLEIESELKKVRSLANAYLVTDDRYKNLDDKELKNAASIIVNSLNENIASQFEKDTDVGDYVQNIIDIIASNKDGVQEALVGLFTTDFSEMSLKDAQPIVDAYIKSIADALDREDVLKLKVELGFEAYDRSRLENSLKEISGSGISYANYGEYKFAEAEQKRLEEYTKDFTVAEQELWLKATNGAQSASEAISLYEDAVAKASEAMEGLFTDAQIKRLDEYQSKIKDLADSYSKLLSGNYSKSDILDILKDLSGKGFNISTIDSINELQGLIKYSAIATDDLDALIKELGIAPDSDLANFLRDMTYETLRVDSAFEGLSTRLSGLKSGYTTLKDAIDEYNKSGKLTTETFDALMNMDYDNLFSVLDGGKIKIDKEGIRKELLDYIADVRSTLIDEETNYVGSWTEEVQEDYRTKKQLLDKFEEYVKSSGFSLDDIFGTGDSSSSTSDFEEQIDWAANSVSNLEREVTNLENILDNTNGFQAQIKAIQDVIDAQERLREGYEKSAKEYDSQYEDTLTAGILAEQGLSDEVRKKIESGKLFDIENFIVKNVASGTESTKQQIYDAIQEAIDWYNKSTDASDNAIEINYKINDNIKEQRQITWDYFDEIIKRVHSVVEESEFFIDLFSNDRLIRKTGEFTASGLATLGQRAVNYNVYIDEAERYAKELKKIYADLSNTTEYDQVLIDRARELQDLQRDSILAYQEEKQAIIELAQEGIQAQIDYMGELIEKKKELLEQDKEELDFQREMEERTKNLNSLRKQESVYALDNSEEGQQRLQTIRAEIEEAEKDMDEFTYDKWHQSQTEMLDNLFSDYESVQNELMDDTERLFKNMMNVVGENSNTISTAIKDIAEDVGVELSPEFNNISTSLSEYASGLDALENEEYGLKAIKEVLERIAGKEYPTAKDPVENNDGGTKEDTKEPIIPTTKEPTKEETPSGSSTGKTPKVGGKVTFASGVYHSSADGTGKTGKKNLGEQVYITKFSNASYAKYPYLLSEDKQGKKLLGWVGLDQLSGYATGLRNAKKDELAWTQENGNLEYIIRKSDGALLTPVNHGDMVLKPEMSKRLWEMTNDPTSFIMGNIKSGAMVNVPRTSGVGDTQLIIENIIMNGVNDPVKFKGQLIDTLKSADVQKAVRSVSTDLVMGKSTFGINKY